MHKTAFVGLVLACVVAPGLTEAQVPIRSVYIKCGSAYEPTWEHPVVPNERTSYVKEPRIRIKFDKVILHERTRTFSCRYVANTAFTTAFVPLFKGPSCDATHDQVCPRSFNAKPHMHWIGVPDFALVPGTQTVPFNHFSDVKKFCTDDGPWFSCEYKASAPAHVYNLRYKKTLPSGMSCRPDGAGVRCVGTPIRR